MNITMKILGTNYTFDQEESQILKRGLIDPYDLSKASNEWVVLSEYILWSHRLQSPIVIPRWFITDLASIPKFARNFISVNERHRLASLPHDLLYILSGCESVNYSRKEADKVLSDFCKVMDVPTWKRRMIYSAVRSGGWKYFGDKKPMYIPIAHRRWYLEQFPHLNLDLDAGQYISFFKN